VDEQGHLRILIADREERLDRFIARSLPLFSRSRLTELIDAGQVLVDGAVEKRSFRLSVGMKVEVPAPEDRAAHDLSPASIPIEVLYEDEDVMVVSKPRGLATHPAPSLREPSLVNALLGRGASLSTAGGEFRPGIVHRLDKETTGAILIAKTDAAHASLAKQIERRTAGREYLAVIEGDLAVDGDWLRIEAPVGRDPRNRLKMTITRDGKPATTLVQVVGRVDAGTVVRCRLETGRTHQIRVHLSSINHPVLGDSIYAPKRLLTLPLQLHAWRIAFDHPRSGARVEVEAPPPADFVGKTA
jgi:23S rRNA pseudouridine1911/1915/1917 synthase